MVILAAVLALVVLLLALKASSRLTVRFRLLAGMSLSGQPLTSCPHVGLAADPFIHEERPSDDHRCYLWMQRDRIDLAHQKGFCLTSAHRQCPWLMMRRPDAPPPLAQRLPGLAAGGRRQAVGVLAGGWRALPGIFGTVGQAAVAGGRFVGSNLVRAWAMAAPLLVAAARWLAWALGKLALAAAKLFKALGRRVAAAYVAWRKRSVVTMPSPPVVTQQVQDEAACVGSFELVTETLTAPAAMEVPVIAGHVEDLIMEGVTALDGGQEGLAYQLFRKATEARGADHRAWFWRAKTAETVEEVVECLRRALALDPDNLQMQAHLAWAEARLERKRRVQTAAVQLPAASAEPLHRPPARTSLWPTAIGESLRQLGGMMAMFMAALWMTSGLFPLLTRVLGDLPVSDQRWLQAILPAINPASLPVSGRLLLPVLNMDVLQSLPFILGFLFLFTGRGLVDGDGWARSGALLVAGFGALLCVAHLTSPDAARLGLFLCVGVIGTSVLAHFPHASKGIVLAGYR